MANALKDSGWQRHAVAIYMGMVPELPAAMSPARAWRAAHVVFGGFSADSLSDRMNDMGARCCDPGRGWRRGKPVPLKRVADEAMAAAPGVRAVARRAADRGRCR